MSRLLSVWGFLGRSIPKDAFTRDILLLCVSNLIGAFGEGLYFWNFSLYVRALNADIFELGVVLSLLMGVAALMPLPGGLLADRFDRRKLMILAWTPWVFAPLIYSLADSWVMLIPGTVCWGLSMLGLPAFTAYVVSSVHDPRKLASVLSVVWGSYSFSYIFAPAVGGYLTVFMDMRWILRITAVLCAISTAVFFFIRGQHPSEVAIEPLDSKLSLNGSDKRSLWRKVLIWAGFWAVVSLFISIGRPFVQVYLNEQVGLSEFEIGIFGSMNYAGITLIGLLAGFLGDRWRKSGAISVCILLYALSMVPLMLVKDLPSLMLAAFTLGGSAVMGSLVSSYVGSVAPRKRQGLLVSIPQTASLITAFVAPYIGSSLYAISPFYAFTVSIVPVPFLSLFALKWLRE